METNSTTRRRRHDRPRHNATQNQNYPNTSNNRRNSSRRDLNSVQNIINLFRKSPSEIVLELFNPQFNLEKLLETDEIDDELATKLIFLFEKAFECSSMSTKLDALMKLISPSKFFQEHILNILSPSRATLVESVLNLGSIFVYLDSFNTTTLEILKSKLEYVIIRLPALTQQLNEFEKLFEECENLNKRKRNATFSNLVLTQNGALDDFTKMNIVPKLEDILNDQTNFLRKNLTNGSYESVHHYLDTQYRLLREDFMRPLRDGVCSFRDIVKSYKIRNKKKDELSKEIMKQLRQIDNLNVYFNVFMDSCIASTQGVVYSLKLDLNGMKILDARRLIYGSLICLSSDYFQSECLIGTINLKPKDFAKTGIIYVKFSHSYLDINERKNIPIANVRYVMLESSVYFEAYKHVLKALCSFHRDGEYKFPFREHLIYSEHSRLKPPDYLIDSQIDFRPLVVSQYAYSNWSFGNIHFRDQSSWPTADDMKLSPAQYDAVKLALNNKLTLIQGPPGTGKTFVGVKIVKLLLHNRKLWWNLEDDRRRPILMVCYTNHALDQFLEYCIDECGLKEGVVRVGGRSRSERLAPFLLSNIKQKLRNENKINRSIKISIAIELKNLEVLRNRLNYLSEPINTILNHDAILRINILKDYMSEKHHDQMIMYSDSLFNKNDLDDDFSLLEWLGFFQDSQYSLEKEESSSQTNSILEDEQYESDNEDLIDERVLESDIQFKDLKKKFSNKNKCLLYENDITKMIDAFQILKNGQIKSEKFDIVNYLRTKTNESLKFSEEDFSLLENVINIWKLDYDQRFFLYLNWLRKFLSKQEELIQDLTMEYNKSASIVEELRLQEDKNVMEQALIVAMTTTGSTRYHNALKDIGPRIVIVEEAAEVFEAHIVGSLSKHCEHLILIGDHVQLRPNPAVYNLAKEYKLDVSLFERLVNNDFKRVMLNKQHRMRPEISVLMKYFYDKPIENNETVYRFPNITGLTKSVFFINHKNMEKSNSATNASKLNPFETNYLAKLAIYLTNCKYAQEDITILSMYLGQTMEIKKQLKGAKLDKIKVSTVDNYQGEENKIILLSLVRSNTEKKIGFLNISNRVCVALSRAKHGFYTIGNFDFICSYESNNKWKPIVNEMKLSENFGDLTLTCGLHKERDLKILNLADFDQRKNCCCNSKCDIQLNCGHKCPQKCHVLNDLEHLKYKCKQTCKKNLICGHICSQICCEHKYCDKCGVLVNKIIEQCGHEIKDIRCDFTPMRTDCNELCNKKLNCGHMCSQICNKHDKCSICPVIVNKCIQQCGHEIKNIRCDFTPMRKDCNELCNKKLNCGHLCSQICNKHVNCVKCEVKVDKIIKECGHEIKSFRCDTEPIRKNCVQKCNKKMYCGHTCEDKCSDHVQCTKCSVKVFKKIKDCGHMVEVRCDYVPSRLDCKEFCVKTLKCGHLCTKKCSVLDCGKCEHLNDVNSTCKHPSLIQSKCSNKIWHYQKECKRPCYEVLKCGHVCESSCSDCFGGYVHTRCMKQVEVKFQCGHTTTTNCFDQQSLTCQKVCSNFCPHGTFSKPCSQPCTPCDRPCEYKCEHFSCTKKCHEFCDRPVCNEPCKKKLNCGHGCIGICGEPCPKICRVCNRETNENLFANPQAKFVLLIQCGHIFESSSLDSYMRKQSLELINQLPQCPRCKIPIRFNYRYSKLIKAQIIESDRVKTSKLGNERQNELFKSNLLDKIKSFNQSNDAFDNKFKNLISSELDKLGFLTQNNLKLYDATWNLFINLKSFKNSIKDFAKVENLEHLLFEVEKLQGLFIFDQGELNLFKSEQMLNDFQCELSRLNYLVNLFNRELKFEKNFKYSHDPMKVSSLLDSLNELLYNKVNRFDSHLRVKADENFQKIDKLLPNEDKKSGCVIS